MTLLVEIIEHAIYGRYAAGEAAAAVLAALRDPPPEVIEAGARALYIGPIGEKGFYDEETWNSMASAAHGWWSEIFLASWRAALNADGTRTRTPA